MRVYVGSENVYVADRMPPTASRAFGGFTMLIIQSRARLWKKILHIYSYTYLYNGDDVWCPIFYFVLLLSTTIKKTVHAMEHSSKAFVCHSQHTSSFAGIDIHISTRVHYSFSMCFASLLLFKDDSQSNSMDRRSRSWNIHKMLWSFWFDSTLVHFVYAHTVLMDCSVLA